MKRMNVLFMFFALMVFGISSGAGQEAPIVPPAPSASAAPSIPPVSPVPSASPPQSGLTLLAAAGSPSSSSQEVYKNTMKASFPNPEKPGLLKIESGNGNVIVTSYAGKEVTIDAQSKSKKALGDQENEKAKGLKRISGSGLNVITKQDENAVVIERSMYDSTDLDIKVPYQTSLKIGSGEGGTGVFGLSGDEMAATGISRTFITNSPLHGNISVSAVGGGMEIKTMNGKITLQNISGNVVSNSLHGDITCTLKSVDKENPYAFSTTHGDIDITVPADTRATFSIKNVDGNVYSDFDMDITKNARSTGWPGSTGAVEKQAKDAEAQLKNLETQLKIKSQSIKSRSMRVSGRDSSTIIFNTGEPFFGMYRNNLSGKINGGGIEIQLSTMNGNIYIRKGK
jgi:hypothetical protein